jgi:diguanylate cyclase (GGDEF)-like protein/PAS domain S-box-containing protein
MTDRRVRDPFVRPVGQPILALIGALVGLTIAIAALFIWYSVREQDKDSRDGSIAAMSEYLGGRVRTVGRIAKDYAWWNDAVQHLQLKLNEDWANRNIAGYLYDTFGLDASLVVDGRGRTVYASLDGERADIEAPALIGHGLDELIRRARAGSGEEPHPAAGLVDLDGQVAIAAVCPLSPEADGALTVPPGEPSFLIVAKRLSDATLAEIASIVRVAEPAIVPPDAPHAHTAEMPLLTADGLHLADLVWEPGRPGTATLRRILPVLLLALAALLLGAARILVYAKRASDALHASEARFRDIASATSDWIWETDAELRCTFVSSRCAEAMGRPMERILGECLPDMLEPLDGQSFALLAEAAPEPGQACRSLLCTHVDGAGNRRTLRLAGVPIHDRHGRLCGYRGTASDVTSEMAAQARIQFLALHDALTELPNRALLNHRLDQAIKAIAARGGSAAVLYIDLDRFKAINDALGHGVGDRLLQAVGERLQANVRKTDTVARLGGDEFIVLDAGIERPLDAERLCRRLLRDFQRPFMLGEDQLAVTISIGVALLPQDGDSLNQILRHADIALLRAKEIGRNTFCFYEHEMDIRYRQRNSLERELQDAIRTRAFTLHYQPMLDLRRNSLVGVEALLRWRHQERGIVLPASFIATAEETGLITPLGDWILTRACGWASARPDLVIAVNISPIQFRNPRFVATVQRALERTGLAPRQLELEVTEGALLENTEHSLATLAQLKRLGVRLSMDDFGTGYSSLSYLLRFEFDKIKIDQSFVQQLGAQPQVESIIRSILTLAHSLGMRVCAEGVETKEQLAFLRDEGCDEAQGFLFSGPVAHEELERLLGASPWRRGNPAALRSAA